MSNTTFFTVPVKANGFRSVVGRIHHATVVPADVHPCVRREPDRDGVVHPPLADRSVIDEQRHLAPVAGFVCTGTSCGRDDASHGF